MLKIIKIYVFIYVTIKNHVVTNNKLVTTTCSCLVLQRRVKHVQTCLIILNYSLLDRKYFFLLVVERFLIFEFKPNRIISIFYQTRIELYKILRQNTVFKIR